VTRADLHELSRAADRITGEYLRDVIAAVGFTFSDRISEEVRDELMGADDPLVEHIATLVGIRRGAERGT
jgi:hypothetical protein